MPVTETAILYHNIRFEIRTGILKYTRWLLGGGSDRVKKTKVQVCSCHFDVFYLNWTNRRCILGGWSLSSIPSFSSNKVIHHTEERLDSGSGETDEALSLDQKLSMMNSMASTCRDRTVEFQSVVRSLKSRQVSF